MYISLFRYKERLSLCTTKLSEHRTVVDRMGTESDSVDSLTQAEVDCGNGVIPPEDRS